MSAKDKTHPTNGAMQATKAKRKKRPGDTAGGSSGDEDDDDDTSTINVDFEWFDPQESDFHGLKALLRQLFDTDSPALDLSALIDLILAQPLLGSTVKVPEDGLDTNKTDPFAFLTVLNLHEHRANPAVSSLQAYLRERASKASSSSSASPALAPVADLLAPSSPAHVGLLLSERFVNMPPQIAPPMYNLLLEEIAWAVADNEPYSFTHYLLVSKAYVETASSLPAAADDDDDDAMTAGPLKKKPRSDGRGRGSAAPAETFYFHAEDEVFARHALAAGNFEYVRPAEEGAADAKRAFQEAGIEPVGFMVLLEAAKLEAAVKDVTEYINAE